MIRISTDSELEVEDQVPWCIVSVCSVESGGGETRYQSALLAFTTQSPGCWIHTLLIVLMLPIVDNIAFNCLYIT